MLLMMDVAFLAIAWNFMTVLERAAYPEAYHVVERVEESPERAATWSAPWMEEKR